MTSAPQTQPGTGPPTPGLNERTSWQPFFAKLNRGLSLNNHVAPPAKIHEPQPVDKGKRQSIVLFSPTELVRKTPGRSDVTSYDDEVPDRLYLEAVDAFKKAADLLDCYVNRWTDGR